MRQYTRCAGRFLPTLCVAAHFQIALSSALHAGFDPQAIEKAGQAFANRDFPAARKFYLGMIPEASAPQAQIFSARAAQCLLFAGQSELAVSEFKSCAERYSDVYTSETLGLYYRLADLTSYPARVQRRLVLSELVRLGLRTEADVDALQGGLAPEVTDPVSAWFPLWQETSAQAVLYMKSAEWDLAMKTVVDGSRWLPQEDMKRLLIDVVGESVGTVQPSDPDALDRLDQYRRFLLEQWAAAEKKIAVAADEEGEVRFHYLLAVIEYSRAACMARLNQGDKAYDEAAAQAQKLLSDVSASEACPRDVSLGADYRLLVLQRVSGDTSSVDKTLAAFLSRYPDSALRSIAVAHTALALRNRGAKQLARTWNAYLEAKFPGSPEWKTLERVSEPPDVTRRDPHASRRRLWLVCGNIAVLVVIGSVALARCLRS